MKTKTKKTDFGISPISIVEEMANEIRDNSDVECNFYQSVEDVPDPRNLSSENESNDIWWSVTWKTKKNWNRIMSEEDTATSIVSI